MMFYLFQFEEELSHCHAEIKQLELQLSKAQEQSSSLLQQHNEILTQVCVVQCLPHTEKLSQLHRSIAIHGKHSWLQNNEAKTLWENFHGWLHKCENHKCFRFKSFVQYILVHALSYVKFSLGQIYTMLSVDMCMHE